MTWHFHPEARAEYLEAPDWYDRARPGLASEFAAEVERAIDRIVSFPHAWTRIDDDVRRCLLTRFPYGVLYAEVEGEIVLLAVMSLHREPGYWRSRLPQRS